MNSSKHEMTIDCDSYEDLIKYFNPKIKKSLRNIPLQEQDDLNQEIHIKIFEKINTMKSITVPGFFEFLNSPLIKKSYENRKNFD
ncbi:hypothetical protein CN330_27500 [Priestia megaterium]|uniref:hypothetical protein n=1 Tax=Priestia megaterium TaxID=1404 RepID=UPI000BF5719A|nr:hypothetical protein [Priestia megaterium]PEZ06117.1 hypothetical protein CN330_27500 [Priestia megaterium]